MTGLSDPVDAATARDRRDIKQLVEVRTRKAYQGKRWRPGQSGNPGGRPRAEVDLYRESRKLSMKAAPDAVKTLITLMTDKNEDGRVRSVCAVAILDRAGIRPIDKPDASLGDDKPAFDPRAYTAQDLAVIEAALRLMLAGGSADATAEGEATEEEGARQAAGRGLTLDIPK